MFVGGDLTRGGLWKVQLGPGKGKKIRFTSKEGNVGNEGRL